MSSLSLLLLLEIYFPNQCSEYSDNIKSTRSTIVSLLSCSFLSAEVTQWHISLHIERRGSEHFPKGPLGQTGRFRLAGSAKQYPVTSLCSHIEHLAAGTCSHLSHPGFRTQTVLSLPTALTSAGSGGPFGLWTHTLAP